MVGPTMRLKLLVGGLALSLGAPLPPQQQALDPSSAQADGSQVKPAEGAMPQVLRGVPHWDSTPPPDPWGRSQPQAAPSDASVPDMASPDPSSPKTPSPDAAEPQTPSPDAAAPQTPSPDTAVPQTSSSDADAPQTPSPDAASPQTAAVDGSAPQAAAAEGSTPLAAPAEGSAHWEPDEEWLQKKKEQEELKQAQELKRKETEEDRWEAERAERRRKREEAREEAEKEQADAALTPQERAAAEEAARKAAEAKAEQDKLDDAAEKAAKAKEDAEAAAEAAADAAAEAKEKANAGIEKRKEALERKRAQMHWEDKSDKERQAPVARPEVDPDVGLSDKSRDDVAATTIISPHKQPLASDSAASFELFTDSQMYRLGDMVASHAYRAHRCGSNETIYTLPVARVTLDECAGIHEAGTVDKYHIAKWPNSLAAEYLRRTDDESNYTVLASILQSGGFAPTSTPKPADALVVHLRVGDVLEDVHLEFPVEQLLADEREVCDDLPAEGNQHRHCYIHNEHYYRRQLAKLPADYRRDTVVLVAGAHQASPAGFPRSSAYIRGIANLFRREGFRHVELRLAQPPDDDVSFMSRARYFIQGGGGYSMMVAGVVKELGGKVFTDDLFGFNLGATVYTGKAKSIPAATMLATVTVE